MAEAISDRSEQVNKLGKSCSNQSIRETQAALSTELRVIFGFGYLYIFYHERNYVMKHEGIVILSYRPQESHNHFVISVFVDMNDGIILYDGRES